MSVRREEYLAQLRARLSNQMTPQELENILTYYTEYFDEEGPAREGQLIQELGSPEQLARQIMGDQVIRDLEQPVGSTRKGSGLGKVWTVILAILAAPVAIPLVMGLVLLVLGLVAALLVLLLGLGAAGAACIGAGIFAAMLGLSVIFSSGVPTTMYFVGAGLLSGGIGVAILAGTLALSRVCCSGITRLLGWNRRREAQA